MATRAANLYFSLKNLAKINKMYQFSMAWFMAIFMEALKKVNIPKQREAKIEDEEYRLLNNKYTVDDRIKLLK